MCKCVTVKEIIMRRGVLNFGSTLNIYDTHNVKISINNITCLGPLVSDSSFDLGYRGLMIVEIIQVY